MATNGINAVEPDGPKKSKLESFANIMGIMTSIAGLLGNAYGAFSPKTAGAALPGALPSASPSDLGTDLAASQGSLGTETQLYKDIVSGKSAFSANPGEFRASEVPSMFGGLPKQPKFDTTFLVNDPNSVNRLSSLKSFYKNPFLGGYESKPTKIAGNE